MLSRAITRALPRSSSRIATFSTRTAFRPSTQLPLRQSLASRIPKFQRAAFSSTPRRLDEASQELGVKLASEIALEQENTDAQHDSDAGVQRFLEENEHWTLTQSEGSADVTLSRKYEDEQITVSFSIVDFNTAAAVGMEGEEGDEAFIDEEDIDQVGGAQSGGGNTKGAINAGGTPNRNFKVAPEDSIAPADREELRDEQDEYDPQQAFPANVNVLIQRSGRGALRINLVTDNGRFTIHGVTHLPEDISSKPPVDLLRDTPQHLYTGPPFQQLDEEVQGMLENYLDVRGVNTALAMFIPDFIDVKEQKEYLGWLMRVKEFVE